MTLRRPRDPSRRRAWPLAVALLLLPASSANAAGGQGSLRGTVFDSRGEPVAGAIVVVPALDLEAACRPDGGFEIPTLATGGYRVEARASGYAVDQRDAVAIRDGEVTRLTLVLHPVAMPLEEVTVAASYTLLRDEPIPSISLSREEIMQLPHFGDDILRAVTVLPGTASGDFTSRFSVRGGLYDEALVRLDGFELLEPFHLKDFEGVFSILDPEIIAGVELTPASYPIEHGDRMSGLLDMTTDRPTELGGTLGISFSNAWVGGAGTLADGRGRWQASARRGYLDVILGLAGEDEGDDGSDVSPRYWDAFGKLEWDLASDQTLTLQALAADDTLVLTEVELDERTDVDTRYGSLNLALSHLALLGDGAVANTVLSASRHDDDRLLFYREAPQRFDIIDDRDTEILSLRQEWEIETGRRHYLKAGFEARSFDAEYRYFNDVVDLDAIDDPRFPPPASTTFLAGAFPAEHYSLWAADRVRIGGRLTAELGVRWDEYTLTDEGLASPRVNLVWDLGGQGVLRAGWGRFLQSQRPYELEVQYGETEFQPTQQADHLTLGFEKRTRLGYRFRLSGYVRRVSTPRARWEILWDPWRVVGEIRPDRVRVAPDEAGAEGVELFLEGRPTTETQWWLSYAWSSTSDEIGPRSQPRFLDQPHTVTASLTWRPGRAWHLSWLWTYHTGWPTTAVSAVVVPTAGGGDRIEWSIGPFYEERLPAYHRLDLRASRGFDLGAGLLEIFLDVQNLYDRNNVRGLAIDDRTVVPGPDGALALRFGEESWFGLLPSFGISWRF